MKIRPGRSLFGTVIRPFAAIVLGAAALAGCGEDEAAPAAVAADQAAPSASFQTVSVRDVAPQVEAEKVLLVDVREQHEWDEAHAPEALHVPLASVEAQLAKIAGAADGRPVAFICRTGSRSAQASALAVRGGLGPVLNVDGGMTAWQQAGLPLAS